MDLALICCLLLWSFPADAAPAEDKITFLPGLPKQPSFNQYSGYLNISGDKHLHYWFVESQQDPSSSPVVLWLNGGPGCSSLDGLLSEHGPFLLQSDGKTLKYNLFSWNKITNVIYLESPAGVGFSYSEDKYYATNDTEVTNNNYLALKEFFCLFPEFSNNDFYIMGESYGGVYVPTLAVKVSLDDSINLKGIAVGNGLTSYTMNYNSLLYFSYYHGIIDSQLWSELQSLCCSKGKCAFWDVKKSVCELVAKKAFQLAMPNGLNIYNLYQPCAKEMAGEIREEKDHTIVYRPGIFPPKLEPHFRETFTLLSGMPCISSTALATFLNRPEIRTVLHIASQASTWEVCSDEIFAQYGREIESVEDQYLELLKKKYRILLYYGDVDMACNFLGANWFVHSLNQPLQVQNRPWYYYENEQKQIGGFVEVFTNLTFLTIKGAGHMAPTDKPNPVFTMFSRFIHNEPI
ncbi:lysosomal protective protein-like [Bombina bombina]|uniref:lysosomal protective protein-like n=1 Tax=Bombina bombina TaxID=8345 RepID=UPI00235B2DED|nr:lysosomal protective protein-like [Bombina bombina]